MFHAEIEQSRAPAGLIEYSSGYYIVDALIGRTLMSSCIGGWNTQPGGDALANALAKRMDFMTLDEAPQVHVGAVMSVMDLEARREAA